MKKIKTAVLLLAGFLGIAMDQITKAYLEAERVIDKQEKSKQSNK